MANNVVSTIQFTSIPNIKWLMVKALFKRKIKVSPPNLPNTQINVNDVPIDAHQVALFHQVVNWQGQQVHPCYIHALVFPLHLELLLQADFPFPLLGLVHIENSIQQLRPITASEKLSFTCTLGELTVHRKGWLFDIEVSCFSQNECVWKSASTNLYRTKHNFPVEQTTPSVCSPAEPSETFPWDLDEGLGRRYAKASGDYNPIHLRKWSAKLLGFKQHIAHGMWTKSRCISQFQTINAEFFTAGVEINCRFKQPLYLPASVNMQTFTDIKSTIYPEYQFFVGSLVEEKEAIPHVNGRIRQV